LDVLLGQGALGLVDVAVEGSDLVLDAANLVLGLDLRLDRALGAINPVPRQVAELGLGEHGRGKQPGRAYDEDFLQHEHSPTGVSLDAAGYRIGVRSTKGISLTGGRIFAKGVGVVWIFFNSSGGRRRKLRGVPEVPCQH